MGCGCSRTTKALDIVVNKDKKNLDQNPQVTNKESLKSSTSAISRPLKPQKKSKEPLKIPATSKPGSKPETLRSTKLPISKLANPQELSSNSHLNTSNANPTPQQLTAENTQSKFSESFPIDTPDSPKALPPSVNTNNLKQPKSPQCTQNHDLKLTACPSKWFCSYCCRSDRNTPYSCSECNLFICSICCSWITSYPTGTKKHGSCPLMLKLLSFYGYELLKEGSCTSCISINNTA